ncbi:MAG TPA: glycosyltransferase family 4 protein [Fulvivirga sp.]|nr:glycosyltransferase family 4 protein [Fulvivirga sp.]
MKKIAHLVNYDRGVTVFLMPQLKALQNRGFEVHAIFPFGDQLENIKAQGITPHHVNICRDISPLADLKLLLSLIRIMRKEKFYLVHAHTAKLEFFGQLAAFISRVPKIVYTNHGVIFRSNMGGLKKKILMVMANVSGKISDLIFSQSREDIDYLLAHNIYSPSKVFYLGNGINTEVFNPSRFNSSFKTNKRMELDISMKSKVIGIVGRFVYEKGYYEFIDAAIKVNKLNKDTHFLCVGNQIGNERDPVCFDHLIPFELKANFTILSSRDDMEELYAIMDIMVLPSHREGFPRALMEGAASGKALIATDISGCREVVVDGYNGHLFKLGDIDQLTSLIMRLVNDDELRIVLGNNGRIMAEAEFDQNSVVERLLKGLKTIDINV